MKNQSKLKISASCYKVMSCPCFAVKENSIETILADMVAQQKPGFTVAINAEKMLKYSKKSEMRQIIDSASFPYPDGAGAVLGLNWLHGVESEKINMPIIAIQTAENRNMSVFVVGASEQNHKLAMGVISERYPNLDIVGSMHGYNSKESIKQGLIKASPDLILLAMGTPRQEEFAAELVNELDKGVIVGCGGALDILAGKLKRAPEFWINNNLEWLYRLIQEPWRWKRQAFLPVFFTKLLLAKLKKTFSLKTSVN